MSPAEITSVEAEAKSLAPPQGWTDDPAHMYYDYYWKGRDDDLKSSLATDYKVPNAEPLLACGPQSGSAMFLLQSRENKDSEAKYYVWNGIEDQLCLIASPTSLKEIYEVIDKGGGYLKDLQLEVVDPEPDEEQVEE